MPNFVIGDAAALRRRQNPALLFEPGDDAFDRRRHILESYLRAVAAGRDDRRLVDKIGEIGTGEARRHGGNAIEIDFGIGDDVMHMHLQNF